jgi:hypothetical protein
MLPHIYHWFWGFPTADLRDTKALLDESGGYLLRSASVYDDKQNSGARPRAETSGLERQEWADLKTKWR